jgi:hypothetical protein
MDIDVIEKAIKASPEETLKRMRRAGEELKKAQQGALRGEPEAGGGFGGVHRMRGRADVLPEGLRPKPRHQRLRVLFTQPRRRAILGTSPKQRSPNFALRRFSEVRRHEEPKVVVSTSRSRGPWRTPYGPSWGSATSPPPGVVRGDGANLE